MTKTDRTPVCPKRRKFQQGDGIFSHILPTVPISHFPVSNFLTPLKNTLRGSRFAKNLELKQRDCRALTLQQSFKRPTYSFSQKGGKSVLIMKETWWKNNLNFWWCVYNCMYSFCGKIGGITFVMPCLLVQIQCRYSLEIFISYLDSIAPFLFLFIPFPNRFHSS